MFAHGNFDGVFESALTQGAIDIVADESGMDVVRVLQHCPQWCAGIARFAPFNWLAKLCFHVFDQQGSNPTAVSSRLQLLCLESNCELLSIALYLEYLLLDRIKSGLA